MVPKKYQVGFTPLQDKHDEFDKTMFFVCSSPSTMFFSFNRFMEFCLKDWGYPSKLTLAINGGPLRGRRPASADDSAAKGAGHRNDTWLFENRCRIPYKLGVALSDSTGSQPKPSWLPLFLGGGRPNKYYCRENKT